MDFFQPLERDPGAPPENFRELHQYLFDGGCWAALAIATPQKKPPPIWKGLFYAFKKTISG
jgi:hypothetical protein